MKKRIGCLFLTLLLLFLWGCKDTGDQAEMAPDAESSSVIEDTEAEETDIVLAAEGTWKSVSGYILELLPEEGLYTYQTVSGRVGQGTLTEEKEMLLIHFGSGLYEAELNNDGTLILHQQDESTDADEESLDGYYFEKSDDAAVNYWLITDMSGSFTNEEGDHMTIYANEMTYEAQTSLGVKKEGTIEDDGDGKGLYLSLEQKGYIIPGEDKDSFTLEFSGDDSKNVSDHYKGIFYRDGSSPAESESVVPDEEEVNESLKEMTKHLTAVSPLDSMEEVEHTDEDTGEYFYEYTTSDMVTTIYNVGTLTDAENGEEEDGDIILKAAEDLAAGEGDTADKIYIEEKKGYSESIGYPVYVIRYQTGSDEEIYRWIIYGTKTDDAVYVYGFKSLTTYYYKVANSYMKVFEGLTFD